MKTVTIFFGEMGCGKTYWGKTMSQWFPEFPFHEGDSVVPVEMAERVSKFKPLTREMILDYLKILQDKIVEWTSVSKKGIFVSQALYFDEDRISLIKYLESQGIRVIAYWIKPPWWQNLWQILSRKKGIRWAIYWAMNKPFFQKPTHSHGIIV